MSKLFKALVIDDESSRNETYLEVLSEKFDVDIINDTNDITRKKVLAYDLLVIDVCLEGKLTAFGIIRDYNLTLPTVLVSGEWVNTETNEPNEYVLEVPNYKNIIKLIGWNNFNKDKSNKQIAKEIYYAFCKYRNIVMANDSDKFVILQLSDTQFGGDVSGAACNDNSRIAKYLREKELIPDIIVFTGDIADKGAENEYKDAKKWIEQLGVELWEIDGQLKYEHRQRFILTPGNHDYDLAVCAADAYDFKFGAEKPNTFEERLDEKDFSVHQKLGFYNFINFAQELTGNEEWYHFMDRALFNNDRFLNFGVNLFTLNSAYGITSKSCENRFDEFYCDLKDVSDDKLKVQQFEADVVNILIMHNPPSDIKMGNNSWKKFQTIIQDNKIGVCLYGHTHDSSYPYKLRDNGGAYCKEMICIPAPTLRLAAAARTEDAMRGFNIIEVSNENGKRSINVSNYKLMNADVQLINKEAFDL